MMMKKWRQHLAALLANNTTFVAGLVLGWTSPALTELNLNKNEESWTGSLALLGALIGAIPAGWLADKLGRKRFLIVLAGPFLIGWSLVVLACSSSDVWILYAGRFVCGLALGATTVAVPLYTNEIAEDSVRGALGVYLDMMLTIGILVVYVLGGFMKVFALSIVCAVLPIVGAVCFACMPETPTHLLTQGKMVEAERALRWLRVRRPNDLEIQMELARVRALIETPPKSRQTKATTNFNGSSNAQNGTLNVITLNRDKEITLENGAGTQSSTRKQSCFSCGGWTTTGKAVFIVMGLMMFMQLTGIDAVIFYLEEIFKDAGSTLSPTNAAIIVGVVQVIANLSSALVVDRLGRRVLLITSEALMAASLASLALYFHLRGDLKDAVTTEAIASTAMPEAIAVTEAIASTAMPAVYSVTQHFGWVPVVALSVFVWMFAFGIGSLAWFMMAELLPADVQDWGASMAICLNWSLGFLVTNVFNSMIEELGGAATYAVFSSICVLGTVFMAFVVPETKGRSQEEIQRLLRESNNYCSILQRNPDDEPNQSGNAAKV